MEFSVDKSSSPHKKNIGGILHLKGKVGVEKELHGVAEENIEFQGKINKQSLAMDILRAGYVQSYIDFFYITNGTLPNYVAPQEQKEEY